MARYVYFAFHYQKDIFRVNVVRNSWVTKQTFTQAGFYDESLWEKAKKSRDQAEAIRRMINDGLKDTSVTAFLLGTETAKRPWVKYELEQSVRKDNGLVAIHIHGVKCAQTAITASKGPNILDNYTVKQNGRDVRLSSIYKTYDWNLNDGYNNIGEWVEEAAEIAGR